MNKQEFYTFIDSYKREKGTYTPDEIFEIGIKHKQLSRNDKSWKELAEYIGYKAGAESLRSFVKNKQQKLNTLPMNDMNSILDDASVYEEDYREKTKIRDIYNAYRATLRSEARSDEFKEAFLDRISKVKPYPINNTSTYNNGTAEAILLFSDLHIGVNCKNFYNEFNSDIAYKRVNKLADDAIVYCHRNNVKDLHVLNLGDLIHGIIHTNARLNQQFDIIDQIAEASELLSFLLIKLANSGLNVTYRSCTDNHSRAIADKGLCIESENFGRLIDMYTTLRLKDSKVTFKNDNVDSSLGKFTLKNGKKVMFAHGHLENPDKCVDAFIGATKEFIDYVFLSHFHAGREKSYNGSKLVINGSIVGTEHYALSKRLFNPAEQKLLIFDNDNFLNLTVNLQ